MLGKILCGICFGMTSIVGFQCYKLRKIEVKKIDGITYYYNEIPGYIPQLRPMFNNQILIQTLSIAETEEKEHSSLMKSKQ